MKYSQNYSQYYMPTLRESPADAVIVSHRLMLRASLMRKLSNGLFAYLPLGLRAFRKLEQIIREEMEEAGCLEVKPTVITPGALWKESGRWDAMGEELLRVKSRTGGDFVVSPTAEEAVTALVRDDLSSYKQLPLSLYQINTKYRDEIRPRYGVMRGREFTMKDAYSFHADEESLDETYRAMDRAYRRIFARCGIPVIPVSADTGAMGGSDSREFMVESEIGDNTLLLCPQCGYAANVEKAECRAETGTMSATPDVPPLQKIDTPDVRTIDELCAFLQTAPQSFIKTLIYRAVNVEVDGRFVPERFTAVCIRGDLGVNETKLAALLKAAEVSLAGDEDILRLTGAPVGFAGRVGLGGADKKDALLVIADKTAAALPEAVTGANEAGRHYAHVVVGRDWSPALIADVRTVVAGDLCAHCGTPLYEKKGNELGHIFKLGRKYTESMNVSCLDEQGKTRIPLMGCYGIGLDRTLASVIEAHHDEAGIIWPATLAPFQVVIVPVKYDGAVKAAADRILLELEGLGIETLLDDRAERAGAKFNDADLIGCPVRIVVGEKNLAASPPVVEVKKRGEKNCRLIPLEKAAAETAELVQTELRVLNGVT
jgi:prolyl-tRNA synthetase